MKRPIGSNTRRNQLITLTVAVLLVLCCIGGTVALISGALNSGNAGNACVEDCYDGDDD